jgi:DNA-binding winged helix-turn-helix (wHTH) protein
MGTNIVEVYINYLRKKLGRAGRHAADRCVIRTLRGRGYVLERESASRKVPSSSPVQEFERIAG